MPVATIGEQDFEAEVLTSELPVLVEFFAEWSQPCKISAPELEAAAIDLEGKAKVVKIDLDKSPRLGTALRIKSVPTFMVFVGGRPTKGAQTMMKKADMLRLVEPYLPRAEGAVKPPELAELLKSGQAVPVDTREASAFGRAHIPGAVHMPLEEIRNRLAELHMLAGAPVLYCRTGRTSKELADELVKEGIELNFLEGGFLAWEAEFLPIERPD